MAGGVWCHIELERTTLAANAKGVSKISTSIQTNWETIVLRFDDGRSIHSPS